ncbi:MAG: hypothetical protein ACYDHW_00915 [Syntrophorhabdaceae bacterium]
MMKTIMGILIAICLVFTVNCCSGSKSENADKSSDSLRGEKAGKSIVTHDGTPAQKVKQLWETTSPVIKSDAKASLLDKDYQEKRASLFSAWVMLQGKLSLAEPKDERAQRVIPEVLKLIDNLYGFPGYKPEKREKDRETAKKYFNERFQKLDAQIQELK